MFDFLSSLYAVMLTPPGAAAAFGLLLTPLGSSSPAADLLFHYGVKYLRVGVEHAEFEFSIELLATFEFM